MMKTLVKLLLVLTIFGQPFLATSQININQKVKNQTNNRANQRTDQAIDKGLNSIENGIKGVFKKKDTTKPNSGEENQNTNENTSNETIQVNQDQKPEQPELQSYSKFDFIPGEKIIFFDDFSQDAVGDFPALWNTNGSAEVVTTNLFPGRWMNFKTRQCIWTDELLDLPENYTIEFDIIPTLGDEGGMGGYDFRLIQSINAKSWDGGSAPGKAGFRFTVEYFGRQGYHTYITGNEGQGLSLSGSSENQKLFQKINQKYHISIWVQKSRIRLYQDENKIFDLPKAFPVSSIKMDRIRFEDGAAMVSNVRIAVGKPDTRNKLITEGKLVTYGIYFDVNKDVVKPESYGTLKDIATVLTENPDVRVKIIGHTDSDGDDAKNMDLSKRRGASVKNELVNNFGIDAARLDSDGLGESQPVAPNDTPSNKALNRRVEFLKL